MKTGRWGYGEVEHLRRYYETDGAAAIARRLRRTGRSVYMKAAQLGLTRSVPRWTAADEARLRELHAAGLSDTEIAAGLGRERHSVSRRRKAWGLPSNAHGKRARAKIAAAVARQCERAGYPTLAHLRLDTWRNRAVERGWPTAICGRPINARHVQILEALWEHGPHTREGLAGRIGMPWKGPRKSLQSNDEGRSYLTALMRAGLVISLGRVVRGEGRGRSVQLYALDPSVERGGDADGRRDQA